MKLSLTYYLTLFVIKLKGIKKDFSKDPIDYKKVRRLDLHHPKGTFFRQNYARTFKIMNTTITEIKQPKTSNKLLLFVHGGAFISGPAKHHWDSVKTIYKKTTHTIWMCDYPKAPEHTISEISENIDAIYTYALKKYQATHITLIGDSVGGTLITALTQRLIKISVELPHAIILICPVMDASMTNPDIDNVDTIDPMLSKMGILSAKRLCAENGDLKNEMLSPIYGSFEKFPYTILYIAEHDITFPDQKLAIEKFRKTNTNIDVIKGEAMPHIWPLLPVMKEAKIALKDIINRLNHNF